MSPKVGIVLATIVVLGIAFFGGFVSVVWTDMIQSLMMLTTLVVLPIVALIYINTNDLSISTSLIEAGDSFNSWFGGRPVSHSGCCFLTTFPGSSVISGPATAQRPFHGFEK
ncbi:hypothetical protein JNUCC1_02602 [Lentibacillus sp. JNUCC-1]|nr:hypothetical protein [Lentibacillus sp. JNUCC-1]